MSIFSPDNKARTSAAGDKVAVATALPEAGLYPELPKEMDGVSFRLQKISELQKQLESEKEARVSLYKKYNHVVNALAGADTALLASGMGLGVGGGSLLSTVAAAPVTLGLELAALCCRLASVGCKFRGHRLQTKAKKHDEIRVLAESKLNTISDGCLTLNKSGQQFYYKGGNTHQNGIGFIVNKNIAGNVTSFKGISDRVAQLTIMINSKYHLNIIQAYLPTSSHTKRKWTPSMRKLTTSSTTTKPTTTSL